jgi:hypothetical protein
MGSPPGILATLFRRLRRFGNPEAGLKRLFFITACVLAACSPSPDPQYDPQHSEPVSAPDRNEEVFAQVVTRARAERMDTLPIGEVIARLGRWFVGAPYIPSTLEVPGPEGLVINLREFDCVTYVESMLALARVIRAGRTDFDAYKQELRNIRYRDGKLIDYTSRLHYFSEWIANNDAKGIVVDVTSKLGGRPDPEPIDFMTNHRKAYRQLADTSVFNVVRAREAELSRRTRYMIPERQIETAAPGIQNGDVIAATSSTKGLDVAHTGIALWVQGKLHMMHAPLVGDSVEVSENPLAQRIINIDGQDGIMVARPQEPR